jgi:hypothetical protein
VVSIGVDPDVRPLVFHGGGYAVLHDD